MTPSSSVKIGVIGCGKVSQARHLPCLQSLPESQVVALADIDAHCLKSVGDRFAIVTRYHDYQDLLQDSALDVAAICLPVSSHVPAALMALQAGKHVFIEKPLCLCQEEAHALIEAAAKSGKKVMLGFNLRWHRHMRSARKIIQQGSLGPIRLVRFLFTTGIRHQQEVPEWRKRRRLGGGVLIENAVHCFDLLRFLFACEVAEIYAQGRSDEWDDETACISCRLENGILAAAQFSESTSDCKELEILGQNGGLRISFHRFDGFQLLPIGRFAGDIQTRLKTILNTMKELPKAIPTIRRGGELQASFYAEWRSFVNCIRQDQPVQCGLEDGLQALQITLAAVRSAVTGRPIAIAQAPRNLEAAISG